MRDNTDGDAGNNAHPIRDTPSSRPEQQRGRSPGSGSTFSGLPGPSPVAFAKNSPVTVAGAAPAWALWLYRIPFSPPRGAPRWGEITPRQCSTSRQCAPSQLRDNTGSNTFLVNKNKMLKKVYKTSINPLSSRLAASRVTGNPTIVLHDPLMEATRKAPCPCTA